MTFEATNLRMIRTLTTAIVLRLALIAGVIVGMAQCAQAGGPVMPPEEPEMIAPYAPPLAPLGPRAALGAIAIGGALLAIGSGGGGSTTSTTE